MLGTPAKVLALTVLLAGAAVAFGLVFANPEQCPLNVTPDVMEATGCNVGANIGLGLVFMVAIGVLVVGCIAAIWIGTRNRQQAKTLSIPAPYPIPSPLV